VKMLRAPSGPSGSEAVAVALSFMCYQLQHTAPKQPEPRQSRGGAPASCARFTKVHAFPSSVTPSAGCRIRIGWVLEAKEGENSGRYATAPASLVLAFFFHPGDEWQKPREAVDSHWRCVPGAVVQADDADPGLVYNAPRSRKNGAARLCEIPAPRFCASAGFRRLSGSCRSSG